MIEYAVILNKLIEDIETRTGIKTRFKIDNQNNGDIPTITLGLIGTVGVGLLPNLTTKSHAVKFKLILTSRASNPSQLAAIIASEANVSKVFPISIDVNALNSERYALSEVDGYKANYYTKWSALDNEMQDDSYERKWDLIMEITIKR